MSEETNVYTIFKEHVQYECDLTVNILDSNLKDVEGQLTGDLTLLVPQLKLIRDRLNDVIGKAE